MPDEYLEALRVLGLEPGATEQAIRDAYRDLVKVWHPDRFGSDVRLREKAQDKLREVNAAFEQLRGYRPRDAERPRDAARPRDERSVRESHPGERPVAHAKGGSTPNLLILVVSALLVGFVGTALFVWRGRSSMEPAQDSIQMPARTRSSGTRQPAHGQPEGPSSAALPTTGSLTVASRPLGARLSFDGRVVGETPITVTDVAPGEHHVQVMLDGTSYQPWSSSVIVTAGQEEKLLAVMAPAEHAREP